MGRTKLTYLGTGVAITVLLVGTSLFILLRDTEPTEAPATVPTTEEVTTQEKEPDPRKVIIGSSHEGRAIESYTYGTGENELLFIGGIHGGYEWNSVLLAYTLIDHLTEHPEIIPEHVTVTIVPSVNPDGLYAVLKKEGLFVLADVPKETGPVGTGRFNARGVDLNRNFDCKWKPESTWRGKIVSAGTEAFSEPEARAIRDLVRSRNPKAVIFWHSQANAVYASECEGGILPETRTLMNIYATSAEYPAIDSFDAYPVSGDAEGWLASIGIPAITVELKTHETIEWEKNLAGVTALIEHYGQLAK